MAMVSFTQAKSIKYQKGPLMKDLSHASISSPIAEIGQAKPGVEAEPED